jgi:hypothetical protein
MKLRSIPAAAGAALVLGSSPALAQSVNVDFGAPQGAPSASYAAAGTAGAWNVVGVLPPAQRAPLVGLDGVPVAAEIYMIGGTSLLSFDDPQTAGDDAALLDDMLLGFNNPLDVCIFFEDLENGDYEVLIYAMTPGDPDLESRVRVDFGTPEIVFVGGEWPGFHKVGVTYSRHTVSVTDGKIGLHSGLPNGNIQSGINGIQLRPLSATSSSLSPGLGESGVRNVFPNPARSNQVIELSTVAPGARVEIVDVAGRLVWRHALGGSAGSRAVAWDGRNGAGRRVPAGVYFVRVGGPGERGGTHRIVRVD